ncbi:hypothetical protein QBC43DRAFT_330250 [Cladorrhinum sp. PSN259]|nr:hypothetical protein QBC43DRAFT_330250 [Cladorrhinum sp. PSN259]
MSDSNPPVSDPSVSESTVSHLQLEEIDAFLLAGLKNPLFSEPDVPLNEVLAYCINERPAEWLDDLLQVLEREEVKLMPGIRAVVVSRVREWRECIERKYNAALAIFRLKLSTAVKFSFDARRLNKEGDAGWKCEMHFHKLSLVLLVLDVEDNENHRWEMDTATFDEVIRCRWSSLAYARMVTPRIQQQYGDMNPYAFKIGLRHNVIAKWDDAHKMLELSGTFSIVRNDKYRRWKTLCRHASFQGVI